ncbi:MAG: zinc-ribbon domain-containing protein [Candidatus Thorarchaeota archaeon]
MDQEDSRCKWCGASISETDKECPTCGKVIARKLVKKEFEKSSYSGVFQQQGRMLTDADWDESVRITKKREMTTSIRCPSCGAIHQTKVRRCNKCGASF